MRREVAAGALLAPTVVLLLSGPGTAPDAGARGPALPPRPNVVVIESDDQTQASIEVMDRVRAEIGERGASFRDSFTNWALCCPSRATLLTGQYAHNHQVLGNQPPLGGFDRLDSSETLPVWLQRAGYFTAHVGKYLNGYENSAVGVPPGWSEWHGSKRTYTFYGYQLLEDGSLVTYGDPQENPDEPADPATYSTDVYTDKAVELIGRRAPQSEPFFLSVAYLAPHSGGPNPGAPNRSRCQGTAKPAARHLLAFDSEPLPAPPSFNEADTSDKPSGIAARPALTEAQIEDTTRDYRCRLESLLAIDEGVGQIVAALRQAGELDETIVIYTADNGFFAGEHRIQSGKNRVYEEAIRVPLLIRGPGVPEGVEVDEMAVNADLAPTVVDAAGAEPGRVLDGRSLLPLARHPGREHGRELLVEQDTFTAIRTSRYVYAEYTSGENAGEKELYDLDLDPYQLDNQVANPAYDSVEAALAGRLAVLRGCAGKSCRITPALHLELRPGERRGDRRRCRPAPLRLGLRGKAAGLVEEAVFRVGARFVARDREAPFGRVLGDAVLRGARRPDLRVGASLLDGRNLDLAERVRVCG